MDENKIDELQEALSEQIEYIYRRDIQLRLDLSQFIEEIEQGVSEALSEDVEYERTQQSSPGSSGSDVYDEPEEVFPEEEDDGTPEDMKSAHRDAYSSGEGSALRKREQSGDDEYLVLERERDYSSRNRSGLVANNDSDSGFSDSGFAEKAQREDIQPYEVGREAYQGETATYSGTRIGGLKKGEHYSDYMENGDQGFDAMRYYQENTAKKVPFKSSGALVTGGTASTASQVSATTGTGGSVQGFEYLSESNREIRKSAAKQKKSQGLFVEETGDSSKPPNENSLNKFLGTKNGRKDTSVSGKTTQTIRGKVGKNNDIALRGKVKNGGKNVQFRGKVNKKEGNFADISMRTPQKGASAIHSRVGGQGGRFVEQTGRAQGKIKTGGAVSSVASERYRTSQDIIANKAALILKNQKKFRSGQAPMPGYNAVRPQYADFTTGYSSILDAARKSGADDSKSGALGKYNAVTGALAGVSVTTELPGKANEAYASDKKNIARKTINARNNIEKINAITGKSKKGIFGISEYAEENVKSNTLLQNRLSKSGNRAEELIEENLGKNRDRDELSIGPHVRKGGDGDFGGISIRGRSGKRVDKSKINNKESALMNVAESRLNTDRAMKMKLISAGVMVAAPGAGIAQAGAGAGTGTGAGSKVVSGRGRSVYQNQNNREQGSSNQESEKKKKKKQKKPRKIKPQITAAVVAIALATGAISGELFGVHSVFETAPAMSTVSYDATHENQDSMTQAAYSLMKSRLESIKNNVVYGETYITDGEGEGPTEGLDGMTPWSGPKYEVTDKEIEDITYVCAREQESDYGVLFEINQALNLYELQLYLTKPKGIWQTGNERTGTGVWKMLRYDRWYNSPAERGAVTMDTHQWRGRHINVTAKMKENVRQALREGIRYLPLYVNEHDCPSDISWVENGSLDNMTRNVSIVHQGGSVGGGQWTYYATPPDAGDHFGYTTEAVNVARAAGWHDEITDGGSATATNTYAMTAGGTTKAPANYEYDYTHLVSTITTGETVPGGVVTTERFVQAAGRVMEWARVGWKQENPNPEDRIRRVFKTEIDKVYDHVAYGGTSGKGGKPCADGYISCDRLVARTLWDLGFTDQPSVGIYLDMPNAGMEKYLEKIGFQKSHNISDVKYGSVVMCRLPGEGRWHHAFIALSYNESTLTMDRYDAGCDQYIGTKQPLRDVYFRFSTSPSELLVFNIPDGGISPDGSANAIGYDASYNLPTIKCSKATYVDEFGNVTTLSASQRKKIAEEGVVNYKVQAAKHTYVGSVYVQREVIDSIAFADGGTLDLEGEDDDVNVSTSGDLPLSVTKQLTEKKNYTGLDLIISEAQSRKIRKYFTEHPDAAVAGYKSHVASISTESLSVGGPAGSGENAIPMNGYSAQCFTFERWDRENVSKHWSPNSKQRELWEQFEGFDEEGFGKIGDRYVIACASTYGEVGDCIDFYFDDGRVLNCIIGDTKNSNDGNAGFVNGVHYGHRYGSTLNVIEFMVNGSIDTYPKWYGTGHMNFGTVGFHPEWMGAIASSYTVSGNVLNGDLPTISKQLNNGGVSLTLKYIGKKRTTGNKVQNWGKASSTNNPKVASYLYDIAYDKLVKTQSLYYGEDTYYQMLLNALTIGTNNVDIRTDEIALKDIIDYGKDAESFLHLDEDQEKERIKDAKKAWKKEKEEGVKNGKDGKSDDADEDDDIFKNINDSLDPSYHYVDTASSHKAKIGYLQYACDLVDASFAAIKARGFEVEYKKVKSDGITTWETGMGTAQADESYTLVASVILYVGASPDDYTAKINKVNGKSWTYSDHYYVYNHYTPDFDTFSTAYNLSGLMLIDSYSSGNGGALPETAKTIYKYLHNKGLSDYCIAGILGNMARDCGDTDESDGKLEDIDPTKGKEKGTNAYGICQWKGSRKKKLTTYADIRGKDISDLNLQLDYLWYEEFIKKMYWGDKEVNYDYFLNSSSPKDAATKFCAWVRRNKSVAKLANWKDSHLDDVRIPEAERAYQLITGQTTSSAGDDYIKMAEMMASDSRVGYCNEPRCFDHNGSDSNLDVDCSSFVFYALYYTGYLSDMDPANPWYTGIDSMKAEILKHGFVEIPLSQVQRGDIVYRPYSGGMGHTEIYLGDGKTIGAHDGNNGAGDPSGKEVCIVNYNPGLYTSAFRFRGSRPTNIPEMKVKLIKSQDP